MNDSISRQAAIDAVIKHLQLDYEYAWGVREAINGLPSAQPDLPDTNVGDMISRQAAIDTIMEEPPEVRYPAYYAEKIKQLPLAQPEVIPHRNYKYLSDYWCECGWHLGKKGEVKYCSECGRKVNWDG